MSWTDAPTDPRPTGMASPSCIFPSAEALRTGLFDSPAGEAAIRADMARFIDFTAAYRVAEYVQKRVTPGP
jgi:hypothetical protein